MLIKDFVAIINNELTNLFKDRSDTPILVRVESQSELRYFNKFLSMHESSDLQVTPETLKPFCEFLSERWCDANNIQNTSASYVNSPKSCINQAYLILAIALSPHVKEHPYKLLMPTLKEVVDLPLHQFVLSDHSDYPINIFDCLDQAAKNNTIDLYHTASATQNILLSVTERKRVIEHAKDKSTFYLYNTICYTINKKIDMHFSLEKYREELFNSLNSNSYQVNPLYDKEGDKLLTMRILSKKNNQLLSLYDFLHLLENEIPPHEWQEFFSYAGTACLTKIVLGDDNLANALKNMPHFDNEKRNRALLFCMLFIYQRQREDEPEYKSLLGTYFGSYVSTYSGTYSKSHELKTAKMLEEFILSHDYSLKDLSWYLKKKGVMDQYGNLLMGYTLSLLVNKIIEIAKVLDQQKYLKLENQ